MIRINLLPVKQIKQRVKTRNEVLAFICMFCALLIIVGFVGYSQASKIKKLEIKTAELEQEKKKYESVIRRIKKIKKEQELLETKLQVIKDLKVNSQVPVRVLDEIAKLTPTSRLWLTTMTYSGGMVNLAGTALDNATVAQFMERMDGVAFFSNTELKSSSMATVAGQKLKSFVMTVNVNKPTASGNKESE